VSSALAERLTGGVSSITLVEMAAEFGVIMPLYLKNARTEREDAGDSN
jgi:Cu(I)/Ag(I) efflux system membrane protein CusA/SilA